MISTMAVVLPAGKQQRAHFPGQIMHLLAVLRIPLRLLQVFKKLTARDPCVGECVKHMQVLGQHACPSVLISEAHCKA